MSLDAQTTRKIARLSRLTVSEDQLESVGGELNKILHFVEKLGEVDTDGVEPMTSAVETSLPWRKDEVTTGNLQAEVLKNAPESREGFFAVPKVVE